jgi:2-desacetyl-2-hydroxyethyl bacteriochlorophyllide A dehydrogenase
MQAIAYRHYGAPDVLELHQRSIPQPTSREVLIRVAAAGVNPIDYRLRQGEMRLLLPGGFPRIPGFDVAGWIEQAQPRSGFSKGDRVIAFLNNLYGGGYAQFAVCSADAVAPLPDSIDFLQAAALPLAGSTALQSLRDIADLRQGDSVLINGASGGVGSLAVQIAKAYGGHVTGVTSEKHREFVRQLGADEVIDYAQTEFSKLNQQWNIVFDAAGKSSYQAARHVLTDQGRFVSTEPSLAGIAMSILTSSLKKKGRVMLARSKSADLRELVRLTAGGQLRVHIDQVLPLAQAAEAHRRLEAGGVCGKLVLRVVEAEELEAASINAAETY